MARTGDEADMANEVAEHYRDLALKHSRKQEGPGPIGHCLWCEEPIPKPRRWCGPDCRDQWDQCR